MNQTECRWWLLVVLLGYLTLSAAISIVFVVGVAATPQPAPRTTLGDLVLAGAAGSCVLLVPLLFALGLLALARGLKRPFLSLQGFAGLAVYSLVVISLYWLVSQPAFQVGTDVGSLVTVGILVWYGGLPVFLAAVALFLIGIAGIVAVCARRVWHGAPA
jgi:hypothetical protein